MELELSRLMIYSIILFIIGNILAWFQANSQFISDWWYNRPVLTVLIYAIPTSFAFFYAWRFAVESLGSSLWSARMLSFGVGVICFWVLSCYIKGEDLSLKTIVCLMLSFMIIAIQAFWKDPQQINADANVLCGEAEEVICD